MDKSDNAYKTIGEVAKILNLKTNKKGDLPTHIIRFWETQFKQIKPKILNSNRRYYDEKSINLLKKVKFLLKEQGMTINGVKKILNGEDSLELDEMANNSIKADNLRNKLVKISIILIILIGGLTRLTDSGLSITTWELFVGFLPPLTNDKWKDYFDLYKTIPEYSEQNSNMSLSEFKVIFWWEWGHRQLGRLIGLTVLLPLIYFTLKNGLWVLKKYGIIFLLVCLQDFLVGTWYQAD